MSIFVSIPSYRDSECQHTVNDLFAKAENPDEITVGICLQYNPDEDPEFVFDRPNQVREVKINYKEAKGPVVARAIIQEKLWRGEQFYLQIDSHMRFVKGWDKILKHYLSQTKNPERSIITSYPVGYQQPNLVPTYDNPAYLVVKGFAEDGMFRLDGKLLRSCSRVPVESTFWVSGFAFSSSRVLEEVPYDPSLEHLFFGEEMLMGARLWTSGWDFYCPGKSVVSLFSKINYFHLWLKIYHLWTRAYRKTFRELASEETTLAEKQSKEKVWSILGMRSNDPSAPIPDRPLYKNEYSFGLGTARTLEEYSQFCGVDYANRKVSASAKLGGKSENYFVDPIQDMVLKASPFVPLQ